MRSDLVIDTTSNGRKIGHGAISEAIARIETLSIHDLRTEWRRVFRRRAPPGLTRTLLIRMLAYQLQADAFGDLEPKAQAAIDGLVEKLAAGTFTGPLVAPLPTSGLQPGTILLREWNGRMEQVTVADDGFIWDGKTLRSLSEVARRITGTSWNGWTFFGLKKTGHPAANAPHRHGEHQLGTGRSTKVQRAAKGRPALVALSPDNTP